MNALLAGLGVVAILAIWLIVAIGSDPEERSPAWTRFISGWVVFVLFFGSVAGLAFIALSKLWRR
jgi:hypothetical protein